MSDMRRKPPKTTEERLVRAQRSMTPGTLGGRVASASPLSVDTTRLDPRLRAQAVPASGGFDPNADPIVIGHGADGAGAFAGIIVGYGASVSPYAVLQTAIGFDATTGATLAVAVGPYASAGGSTSVAIGEATVSSGADDAIAIGDGATAANLRGIAIGFLANAGTTDTIAIGPQATAGFATSVAIGSHTSTTKAHQIMLGTSTEFVEIPGSGLVLKDTATSTRYLVQITSGALVLNTAP